MRRRVRHDCQRGIGEVSGILIADLKLALDGGQDMGGKVDAGYLAAGDQVAG